MSPSSCMAAPPSSTPSPNEKACARRSSQQRAFATSWRSLGATAQTCTPLRFQKPVAFVPRRRRFEVRERIDAQGCEIEPLEQADLEAVVEQCRKQAIEAIAVQFLHSYVAPEHEAACAAFLREKLPDVAVTASHEITREWREYERGNTAVLNAYVQPIVQRYFTKLEGALRELGIDCPFTAMQSNGGTTSFGWAKGASDHAHRIGAGGRGERGGADRRALRRAQRDLPGCGRYDGQVLGDRGRTAQGYHRVQARMVAAQPGIPGSGPGGRSGGDRCGRRFHRTLRCRRLAPGRAAERRRRPRARLLRPRRLRADGDRCQAPHRRPQSGKLCRRPYRARHGPRAQTPCRPSQTDWTRRSRMRRRR